MTALIFLGIAAVLLIYCIGLYNHLVAVKHAVAKAWEPVLHARLDLNNDGELGMKEWMLARSAAKREVAKRMREAQTVSDIHIICQPRDGRLFLISNLKQDDLSRRYLFWAWAHLVIFFGALGGAGRLLQTPASVLGLDK